MLTAILTLIAFGVVLGLYVGISLADWMLLYRLRHRKILKAGDAHWTVKVLEMEEFGFVQSDGPKEG